jgi:hypothetical protein
MQRPDVRSCAHRAEASAQSRGRFVHGVAVAERLLRGARAGGRLAGHHNLLPRKALVLRLAQARQHHLIPTWGQLMYTAAIREAEDRAGFSRPDFGARRLSSFREIPSTIWRMTGVMFLLLYLCYTYRCGAGSDRRSGDADSRGLSTPAGRTKSACR